MHFFNESVERGAQDFKAAAWESIHNNRIKLGQIASSLGVDQGTVSRWFDVAGDLHFPAGLIPALSDERVTPMREDLLRFLTCHSGYNLARRIRVIGHLNGTLSDETVDISAHLGKIAEQVQSGHIDKAKAQRQIDAIRQTCDRAEAELEAKP